LQFAICILQFAILNCWSASCFAAIRVEAYRGEPFGLGRVTIDLQQGDSPAPASDDRVGLVESRDRVLYPTIEDVSRRPARTLLRGFLGVELPNRLTILFMFLGDESLDLTAYTPSPQRFTIEPEDNAEEFQELLDDWWAATAGRYKQVFREAEYPVVVENFVTATWARRLEREMPEPSRYFLDRFRLGEPWMSQLMANEAYQTQVERDLLLGRFGAGEEANIPLPRPAEVVSGDAQRSENQPGGELPAPAGAPPDTIEPIATHVPQECFYLRFGNFPNYLWFRDFMRHWQGDLGNMVVLQSVNHDNSDRFQNQIAVGESKIARVMGPTVIRDVAIIGLDPYMQHGAAMGILFQANNNLLLNNNLSGQRQEAKGRRDDAVEETVRIAGHDVSFIHTPDGRLRSFYAVDGDYHLVANSRRLVERFYEAGAAKAALAGATEFADVRAAMPLKRDDTIFLFVPSAFFQNLAGPHYRIELDRRLRSIGEMHALTLARFAARAEGYNVQSIDDLVKAELLPIGFANRSDGSKVMEINPAASANGQSEATLRDSLRGETGSMTPIPDMPIDKITESEARRYEAFLQEMQSTVGNFAPIAAALKRTESPARKDWDRITAEIRIAPYSQMPIARWPNMLGPAITARVAPIAGDVVSLELVINALGEPVHLFGGLRDFSTPLVVRQGEVKTAAPTSDFVRAYVGGWPRPHLIDRFLGRADGPVDNDGFGRTRGLFDLWFRRADDFFLFSFKRDVLMEVGPQLAMMDAEHPGQIHLRIDDLSDKQLGTAVSGFGYTRARDTSASASRFMNSLTTQLHVSPDAARPLGEALVGGTFDCPLGGDYVLVDPAVPVPAPGEGQKRAESLPAPDRTVAAAAKGGRLLWASTAPAPQNQFLLTEIPANYQMPLMDWFRGLSADVARIEDDLKLNATLDMVHIEVGPPEEPDSSGGDFKLPNLGEIFGGFGKKKDNEVKPAAASDKAVEPIEK
jgi:hypothetical protein